MKAGILLVVAGFLAFALARGTLFGPAVSQPVAVRGGSQEEPLTDAIQAFNTRQIVDVLPRDAIPALVEPRLVPARRSSLNDTDLVIGVERDGEARAYSVGLLSAHEIVDDRIRGHPIAVTW